MRKNDLTIRQGNALPLLFEGTKIVAASLLLVLASQISLLLPFTPVAMTFQTLALFFIGFALGPVKGALAVLLYLIEGACGAPVFALGQAGLAVLLGPRGGYYVGFIAATFISGLWANKEQSFWRCSAILILANASIYLLGLSWLGIWVGYNQVLALGFFPFIIGDLMKIAAMVALVKGYRSFNS